MQGFQYGVCEVEIRRHVRKQARFHETRVSDCVQVLRPCHRARTHSKGTILLRCVVLDFVVGCRNYCICKNCNAGFTCSAQFICVRWKHLTGSLVVHYTLRVSSMHRLSEQMNTVYMRLRIDTCISLLPSDKCLPIPKASGLRLYC